MKRTTDEEFLRALVECNHNRAHTAERLGITRQAVFKRLASLREQGKINADEYVPRGPGAGREITSVTTHMNSDGRVNHYVVKEKPVVGEHTPIIDAPIHRQSTYYGRSGEIMGQWNIRVRDKNLEMFQEMIDAAKEEIPQSQISMAELDVDPETVVCLSLSDIHVGEACVDLDMIRRTIDKAVRVAPSARCAILAINGDWHHYDSLSPMTSRSRNVLHSGMSYEGLSKAGVRLSRYAVAQALSKYPLVKVVVTPGNHDDVSAFWLRQLLAHIHESDDRVEIVSPKMEESPFYGFRHHSVFLGYHHGHVKSIKEPKDLILIFQSLFREEIADCKFINIHTAHLHHLTEIELNGVRVTQHPTLSTGSYYERQMGYFSRKAMMVHVYSAVQRSQSIEIIPD